MFYEEMNQNNFVEWVKSWDENKYIQYYSNVLQRYNIKITEEYKTNCANHVNLFKLICQKVKNSRELFSYFFIT